MKKPRLMKKGDHGVSEIIGTLFVFSIVVTISGSFILWYVPYASGLNETQFEVSTKQALSGFSNQLTATDIQNNSIVHQNIPMGIQGAFFNNPTSSTLSYSKGFSLSLHYNVTIEATFSNSTPSGVVSNKLVANVPVGQNPNGVVVDTVNNLIFVLNSNYTSDSQGTISPGYVSVLNGATDTVGASIPLSGYPSGMAFDPYNNLIFIAEGNLSAPYNFGNQAPTFQSGFIQVIDGNSLKVVQTVYFSSAPDDVTFVPYLNSVMITTYFSVYGGAVVTLNATTFAQTGYIVVAHPSTSGSGVIPSSISYDPANGYVYVALGGGPEGIAIINPIVEQVIGYLYAETPWSLAYDTSTGSIFATESYISYGNEPLSNYYYSYPGGRTVFSLNGANDQQLTAYYGQFDTPVSLVYDRANQMVYVADFGNSSVYLFNGVTGKYVGFVANYPSNAGPGNGPNAMDWDPITGQIFVPNWNSGTVSVISGSTSITNQFASADNNFKPVDTLNSTGEIESYGTTQFVSQNYYYLQDGLPLEQGSGNSSGHILSNLPLDIKGAKGLYTLSSTIINMSGSETSISQTGSFLLSGRVTSLNNQIWTRGQVLNILSGGKLYSATVTSILLNNMTVVIRTPSVAAWNYSLYQYYSTAGASFNSNPSGTHWQLQGLPFRVIVGSDSIYISTLPLSLSGTGFTGLNLQAFQFEYLAVLLNL